jgi:1-aminocyclopropane-1-carboxylate deaminase/D-cysteine desulfhydrase-like pyridoxal-dependent ACC family enzyme
MQLIYLNRSAYRQKTDPSFLTQLSGRFPSFHFVPEGGGGRDGMKGAQLMMDDRCQAFDVIVCAVGTGTSAVGIAQACGTHQTVWGIPIHKHIEVVEELGRSIPDLAIPSLLQVTRFDDYHFGGYAKWTPELIEFIRTTKANHDLPLDPIYTGKAFYALLQEIQKGGLLSGSKVLFIHTGGLQGNAGFEQRFGIELYEDPQKSHKKP